MGQVAGHPNAWPKAILDNRPTPGSGGGNAGQQKSPGSQLVSQPDDSNTRFKNSFGPLGQTQQGGSSGFTSGLNSSLNKRKKTTLG